MTTEATDLNPLDYNGLTPADLTPDTIARYLRARRWRENHIASSETYVDSTYAEFLRGNTYEPFKARTYKLADGTCRLELHHLMQLKAAYCTSGITLRDLTCNDVNTFLGVEVGATRAEKLSTRLRYIVGGR
ncbi:MAG: hypothetical protein ACTHJI_17645 [Leifsonia sp.]